MDIVFECFLSGNSIKFGTIEKRPKKKVLIQIQMDRRDAPTTQVRRRFEAMNKKKKISERVILIAKDLGEDYEMITEGEIVHHNGTKSTRRTKDDINNLNGNKEKADTRIILHTFAVDQCVQQIPVSAEILM